jgi:hypothetical protein
VLREFDLFEGYKSEEDDVDNNDIISLGFAAVNEAKRANRETRSTRRKRSTRRPCLPTSRRSRSLSGTLAHLL